MPDGRPAIRDQLILQSRTINIDEIVREVVQHTVVDIPHHYMSVNVFSLFNSCTQNPSSHVAWNSIPKTSITDAQWKYLEISAPSESNLNSPDLEVASTEGVLVQEILRRMDKRSNTSWPERDNQLSPIETNSTTCGNTHPTMTDSLTGSWSPEMPRKNEIISRLGIDQVSKWKLSKDFARKHTFLDCSSGKHIVIHHWKSFSLMCISSAVATYDMVSALSVLEAEATAC
jgi:hypothetical protein